jgi:hypothetical protein
MIAVFPARRRRQLDERGSSLWLISAGTLVSGNCGRHTMAATGTLLAAYIPTTQQRVRGYKPATTPQQAKALFNVVQYW